MERGSRREGEEEDHDDISASSDPSMSGGEGVGAPTLRTASTPDHDDLSGTTTPPTTTNPPARSSLSTSASLRTASPPDHDLSETTTTTNPPSRSSFSTSAESLRTASPPDHDLSETTTPTTTDPPARSSLSTSAESLRTASPPDHDLSETTTPTTATAYDSSKPTTKTQRSDSIINNNPDYESWLLKVQKNGYELEYAPEKFRDDEKIVIAAVRNYWWSLRYATPALQNNKQVAMAAVQRGGCALKYVSPELQNDKQVVMEAVKQNGDVLEYVSPELQNDKQVVMAAVQKNGSLLQYVSPELRNDKQVVTAAVQKYGVALQYVSPELRNDKQVVMAAVKNNGDAMEFASEPLRDDPEVVLQNAESLKYASDRVRADKKVVVAAIKAKPLLIKYALSGLNQDREVLIAAGIWEEIYPGDDRKQITLSTRFSLEPNSTSMATLFTILFKRHEYIRSIFSLYSPNAWAKSTCDPIWTDFDHKCRGTCETCQFQDSLKTGEPKPESCWRYSFRHQLEKSKRTNGFMLQILEAARNVPYGTNGYLKQSLGKGQTIEKEMAGHIQVKVFRVSAPVLDWRGGVHWELPFKEYEIEKVVAEIRKWYDGGCNDMSECEICFNYDEKTLKLRNDYGSPHNF